MNLSATPGDVGIDGVLRRRAGAAPDRIAYTFIAGSAEQEAPLSYAQLDRRARAIGAALQARGLQGSRALLMFDFGPAFAAAFFGCLYAGVVAVPSYPPHRNRGIGRVRAIARDCAPSIVLLQQDMRARSALCREEAPELMRVDWLDTDTIADAQAASWRNPGIEPEALAFLQYTSGSASTPKGVMLTHANLMHNQASIHAAFEHDENSVVVGWLPLFHDMGLIGNLLQPLYAGCRCVLMSPTHFLQRPVRWLRAISRHRATTSGGPNFAYDLCVEAIKEEERAGLDLSSWSLAFNGAERVRAGTIERFAACFAQAGFRRTAFYPCYGLAEGTLIVTGGHKSAQVRLTTPPQAVPGEAPALRYVGSGGALPGHRVCIVDPATRRQLAEREVGEIWITGGNLAAGYWNRVPDGTDFAAALASETDDEAGHYFRTGDLGFLENGELFVTGRAKELIVVRGRNLYPEDLEATVAASDPGFRPHGCAVISLDSGEEERICVLVELQGQGKHDLTALRAAVDRNLAREHDVVSAEMFFLRPRTIPKTSSGKIQRYLCRRMIADGTLPATAAT